MKKVIIIDAEIQRINVIEESFHTQIRIPIPIRFYRGVRKW